jgi:putative chitinase
MNFKNKSDVMEFSAEMLAQLVPSNKDAAKWHTAMCAIFPKYEINTTERIAGFVAQCAHESNEFKSLEENLNYSEESLKKVFGRYFGPGKRDAKEYAKNPEKIANYVYQDEFRTAKMGNTKPGDGWLFRGRGLKQLTGRDNYTAFGKTVNMTAEEAAVYVATEKGAIESACWFWNNKKLNAIADTGDIVKMTKIINGGDIGLDDRKKRFEKALSVLGSKSSSASGGTIASVVAAATAVVKSMTSPDLELNTTLTVGSTGDTVKAMQEKLGIGADGAFGLGTSRAVKAWQAKNGLVADGIAGPATLKKMFA